MRNPDWIVPDWPAPANVRALVTTRAGGVSAGAWNSMNLGLHVGDDPDAVQRNRRILREFLPAEPAWLDQVHGRAVVDASTIVRPVAADASFATEPGVVCAVLTADCLPVLLCDHTGTVVAAAHAGWRGLANGILEATVGAMGLVPDSLMAWLGPAIGPKAFEVGAEVREIFCDVDTKAESAFVRGVQPGKWMADLFVLAHLRLAQAGVLQVVGGNHCTHGDGRRFYSYRRDGPTGRFASLVWLV
jgi:polyphenol oxidase